MAINNGPEIGPGEQLEWERQHALAATELVIGIVGAVGTDLRGVSDEIGLALDEFGYETTQVGLSDLLHELDWQAPLLDKPLDEQIATHMDAGDQLRERWERPDALAMLASQRIVELREQSDVVRRAYLLRSLKTPAEVETLRQVYGSRFILIGVYAPDDERNAFLTERIAKDRRTQRQDKWAHSPTTLMRRDESEQGEYGQNVRDTFPRADCFVNSAKDNDLVGDLRRLLKIFFAHPFTTPTRDEFALCEAAGAARLSSEPGRQVGAALASVGGDIIALGTNEVPRPGGGFYRADDDTSEIVDKREFEFDIEEGKRKVDTNDLVQREIAGEIVKALDGLLRKNAAADEVLRRILSTRLGALTEFGRAVHAEMSALLDAARKGHAVKGSTMYVTTFPCHNCARHLLGAGVKRVVYIAPYAKSMAAVLHAGDILVAHSSPPDDVLHFEPFVGVAPHRYLELFGDIKRKNDDGTLVDWDATTAIPRLFDAPPTELRQNQPSYRVRELLLARAIEERESASGLKMRSSGSADGQTSTASKTQAERQPTSTKTRPSRRTAST
ncbi:MAG: deaminase [Solirubrobacteraceae bacterium]